MKISDLVCFDYILKRKKGKPGQTTAPWREANSNLTQKKNLLPTENKENISIAGIFVISHTLSPLTQKEFMI